MQREMDEEPMDFKIYKKVSFRSQVLIHYLEDDENLWNLYRKDKTWYFAAINRLRFQEKIKNFNNKYGYIFNVTHRNCMKYYLDKCNIL
jgi:hypothetical protein